MDIDDKMIANMHRALGRFGLDEKDQHILKFKLMHPRASAKRVATQLGFSLDETKFRLDKPNLKALLQILKETQYDCSEKKA